MSAILFPIYTLAHVALLVWGFRLTVRYGSSRQGSRSLLWFAVLITAGLIYDNLILALGMSIGAGDTLMALSVPRFFIHALLTPTMILVGMEMAQRAGVEWLKHPTRIRIAWAIVIVLIVVGFAQGFIGAHWQPACFDGTLRYTERVAEAQMCAGISYPEQARAAPPLAPIFTIVILIVQGVLIWRKTGIFWVFAGAAIMLIGAMIPISVVGGAVSNGAETLMMVGVFACEAALQRRTNSVRKSTVAQSFPAA